MKRLHCYYNNDPLYYWKLSKFDIDEFADIYDTIVINKFEIIVNIFTVLRDKMCSTSMICALNDILLPPILFMIYVVVLSFFCSSNHRKKPKTKTRKYPKQFTTPHKHSKQKKPYSTSLYLQLSNYLDCLNKSKIKELGAALDIQLKCSNGDKTIELIKLEIRGIFRHSPQTVMVALGKR